MKNITVFGQQISREQAIEIIFDNITRGVEGIEECDFISHVLLECDNWKSIGSWSDKELTDFINDSCEEEDLELLEKQS